MNKSKKVISTFENLNKIKELNIKFQKKSKVTGISDQNKLSPKNKKTKNIKKKQKAPRTLWFRRKKSA